MTEHDYKYTLQVDPNSWYIRFYCWLWMAETDQINFCKLFWAYAFILPGLVFHVLLVFVDKRIDAHDDRIMARRSLYIDAIETPPIPKGPSKMQKVLEVIGHFFSKLIFVLGEIGATLSQIWSFITKYKSLNRIVLYGAIGVALLISLGAAAFGVYLCVIHFSSFTIYALGVLLGIIVSVALMIGLDKVGFWRYIGSRLFPRWAKRIKKGRLSFGQAMQVGYWAIKTNTCPKVEVISDTEAAMLDTPPPSC